MKESVSFPLGQCGRLAVKERRDLTRSEMWNKKGWEEDVRV